MDMKQKAAKSGTIKSCGLADAGDREREATLFVLLAEGVGTHGPT